MFLLLGACAPEPSRVAHYVTADTYDELVVEVDWMLKKPDLQGLKKLEEGLLPLIDKPGGIRFDLSGELEPLEAQAWDLEALETFAATHRDLEDGEGAVTMHVLFVTGYWHEDTESSQVLGVALDDRRVVVFTKVIRDLCLAQAVEDQEPPSCAIAEIGVFYHEMGHLLGLVNRGLAMETPHEDEGHLTHCDNPDCIMHWSNAREAFVAHIESRVAEGNLDPIGFDASCQADLLARRVQLP